MQNDVIAQENMRAAASKIIDMNVANELVNVLREQILDEPEKSILAYSNLKLSGRHIVWQPTKH